MKKKSNRLRLLIVSFSVLLALIIIINILIITNRIDLRIPELDTQGFIKVDVNTAPNKVILYNTCISVVGSVSDDQVHSIENALLKTNEIRPLSHDTTSNILKSYHIEVIMVKVTEIKESNFIGKLFLKSDNKITSLDVRPSDGIAIALRNNAPIYMNETLFREQGVNIC